MIQELIVRYSKSDMAYLFLGGGRCAGSGSNALRVALNCRVWMTIVYQIFPCEYLSGPADAVGGGLYTPEVPHTKH